MTVDIKMYVARGLLMPVKECCHFLNSP